VTTDDAAVDLCALLVLQAVPALALDPKVASLGWEPFLHESDPLVDREVVIGFVGSVPIRGWAAFMVVLDHEDGANEWDHYRAETLLLAQVIIGAVAVFDRRAGWDQALDCERYVGYYLEQIWHRRAEPVLSDKVIDGASYLDLAVAALAAGRTWADESRHRHEDAARPWPPAIPRIPPPRPPSPRQDSR
jgi:hypothetical protein